MTTKLTAFAAATNNELFDPEWKGGEWMIDAVETRETIEQFVEASARWNERSAMRSGTIAGFPFVAWKNCQAIKGQVRRTMSVVDFGDVRFAIDSDLTSWA